MLKWLLQLPQRYLAESIFFEIEEDIGFLRDLLPYFDEQSSIKRTYELISLEIRLVLKIITLCLIYSQSGKPIFRKKYQESETYIDTLSLTKPITISEVIGMVERTSDANICYETMPSSSMLIISFGYDRDPKDSLYLVIETDAVDAPLSEEIRLKIKNFFVDRHYTTE